MIFGDRFIRRIPQSDLVLAQIARLFRSPVDHKKARNWLPTLPHPLAPSVVVQSMHRGPPKGRESMSSWPVHPALVGVVQSGDGWAWVRVWRGTDEVNAANSWRPSIDGPDIWFWWVDIDSSIISESTPPGSVRRTVPSIVNSWRRLCPVKDAPPDDDDDGYWHWCDTQARRRTARRRRIRMF